MRVSEIMSMIRIYSLFLILIADLWFELECIFTVAPYYASWKICILNKLFALLLNQFLFFIFFFYNLMLLSLLLLLLLLTFGFVIIIVMLWWVPHEALRVRSLPKSYVCNNLWLFFCCYWIWNFVVVVVVLFLVYWLWFLFFF